VEHHHPPAGPVTIEDLYAEHAQPVLRFLGYLGIQGEEQEDAAQEVWIAVLGAMASYDPRKGTERAWVFGFAYNVARNWHRTRRRHPDIATPTDAAEHPLSELRTGETAAMEAEQRAALWAFVERAVPNADQRAALVLHEIEGMKIEEVAKATGVTERAAKGRIEMARTKLNAALDKLTEEERDRMRAVVLPLGGVDGILRALRETAPPVSDAQVARVWDRVVEHIEAQGGSIEAPIGARPTAPTPPTPEGYTFTGPGLASTLAGVFLLGVLAGATALYAFLSRDQRASMTTVETEIPIPVSTLAPRPEPAPTASAAPSVISSAAPAAWQSETLLMKRIAKAAPWEALKLAEEHARLYPRSPFAAEREETAIRALLDLGQRDEAETRAAKLVRWAPWKAPNMGHLFGRSFL
jgi:RNA polymerase sigma-70 factor, ECF subfamily